MRLDCTNKLQWDKLKAVFVAILLPILVIGGMIAIQTNFNQINFSIILYVIPFIWIACGLSYLLYMGAFGWSERTKAINLGLIHQFTPCPN
jgi:hypothetical protein